MAFVYWIRAPHHKNINKEGYVGVTIKPVAERFSRHVYDVNNGSQLAVHRAMRKYGSEIIVTTLVEDTEEFCYLVEEMLRPKSNIGYNAAKGGDCSPTTGRTHSKETRAKISKAHTGKKRTPWSEERKKARVGKYAGENHHMYGRVTPDETKRKLSAALKGVPKSEEARKNYKAAGRKGADNPNFGKLGYLSHNSNKNVWLCAEEIYDAFHSVGGCGQHKLSKLLCAKFTRDELETITKRLKEGWSPYEDLAWQEFKQNNEDSGDYGKETEQ